jgi:hypothetical protein
VEAFVWLTLASRHGVGLAMAELEELVRTMSAEQKSAASQRLAKWSAGSPASATSREVA